jgi:hypothetical protein
MREQVMPFPMHQELLTNLRLLRIHGKKQLIF